MMLRRKFLQNTALASSSIFVPQFLQAYNPGNLYPSRMGKVLVVIQLSGGNDGLNTVVPFRNDLYYQKRPRLALSKEEILRVSDDLGFHPSLAPLQELYDQGLLTVVNNVGYPNPDRSHFRSMDIWHSASDSNEYLSTGWIGRYLDSYCPNPYYALEVDDSLSLAMKGQNKTGFAFSGGDRLRKTTKDPFQAAVARQSSPGGEHDNVAYLYKTLVDTRQSASYLIEQSRTHRSKTTYPPSAFGRDLKQIAELITADTDTRVYYTSMTGFDTHAGQQRRQANLLKQYAEGVSALVHDLQQNKLLDDVLIMTFSEFGRRVQENGSGGTDHGTANNLFLMGGQLAQPGFYNQGPNLVDLDQGDLKYQIDFREVYATILNKWLDANSQAVLGKQFTGLNFV